MAKVIRLSDHLQELGKPKPNWLKVWKSIGAVSWQEYNQKTDALHAELMADALHKDLEAHAYKHPHRGLVAKELAEKQFEEY